MLDISAVWFLGSKDWLCMLHKWTSFFRDVRVITENNSAAVYVKVVSYLFMFTQELNENLSGICHLNKINIGEFLKT